ncbi:MAG: enoyl-CoA hydratase [Dehalococcoidia bacterium]|nr:enoyl-CoA hydratase [Dehalococcoidia bacterium]
MKYKQLIIGKGEGICTIKLNRPDKLNALVPQLENELVDALVAADQDNETKVVIITGAGRAFCAGLDIKEAAKQLEGLGPILASFERLVPTQMSVAWIPWIIRNMKKPVIAAVNGAAIGAGFTIALACDMRIASEKAQMGAHFANVGLIPEFGSTYNLPRLIGIAKACELVFTGNVIDAAEAKEIGLVNRVVAADDLEVSVRQLAATIAKWPSLPIQLAKRALYQGLDSDLVSQLQFEAVGQAICAKTEDHKEGLRAFLEKRKPTFKNR